jgi:hypothetical protein
MLSLEMKSALIGLSVLGGMAANASAVILFDSHGFEPLTTAASPVNYNPNPQTAYSPNVSLLGQPAAALPQNRWTGGVQAGANSNVPLTAVYSYVSPSATNKQYVVLQAPDINPTAFGYFYPQTNTPVADGGFGTYSPPANQAVAITFSMSVSSNFGSNAFFGVVAFNGAGTPVAQIGINNSTGGLALAPGATTVGGAYTSPFDTSVGYELLLDYGAQTYSVFTQPLTGNPVTQVYTLRATGSFANTSTDFSDADLATFALGATNANGYAVFDDYLVQTVTVPEPASLATGGLVIGLLLGRRRRSV